MASLAWKSSTLPSSRIANQVSSNYRRYCIVAKLQINLGEMDFLIIFRIPMLHLLDTAKVSFLNKLIDLVNVGNGAALEVSSSKIVSGLEPLKTTFCLQPLAALHRIRRLTEMSSFSTALVEKQSRNFKEMKNHCPMQRMLMAKLLTRKLLLLQEQM